MFVQIEAVFDISTYIYKKLKENLKMRPKTLLISLWLQMWSYGSLTASSQEERNYIFTQIKTVWYCEKTVQRSLFDLFDISEWTMLQVVDSVAVPLFETWYLSLFWADCPKLL